MKKLNTKLLVLLVSAALLLTFAVSGTVAYLADATGGVVNTFQPASVIPQINEPGWEENKTSKQNVTITNIGKTDGYFRAAIIVTWRDTNGNIYPKMPVAGVDYSIDLNTKDSTPWTAYTDGYYYYNDILSSQETSKNLINSCTPVAGKAPEGYKLHVAIAAQGVQATGMSANAYGAIEAFQLAAQSPVKQ